MVQRWGLEELELDTRGIVITIWTGVSGVNCNVLEDFRMSYL